MKMSSATRPGFMLLLLSGLLISTPVLAEKPEGVGHGKNKHSQKHEQAPHGSDHDRHGGEKGGSEISLNMYFGDHQREVIHEYYAEEFHSGHCPPGLAKKHNGCMPPGQAKKWKVGYRLPSDVVYYDLPPSVVIEIGTPPAGYKYVRVAKDILLIAVGTSMVIDAVEDLGNL
jgi:Ni/Co efflux regulator RcnB